MRRARVHTLSACLALCALATRAFAQEASDLERAKESFKAGAAAYAAGEYLAAIQALDAAYELTPLPAIAFSLAQAERRQYFVAHEREHLERAVKLFRRYVEQVPSGGRRADALEALSQLEPLVAVPVAPSEPPAREPDAVRRTRLMVTSEAPGARVAIDDAGEAPSPVVREVRPGAHHLRVRAEGFFPTERDVTAIDGELILNEVTLRERPSVLALWSPVDSEIYIDGAFVSQGGAGILVQLPSGRHRLVVAQKGHKIWQETVRLERGKTHSIRATLEPTTQRVASQVLLISGGSALGASLVLGALAVRAQSRAETFLAKQARGNVSSADLIRYHAAVADRDTYRTATSVGITASVGMFITGLFLHELDQPNPQLLYRALPSPENDRGARGRGPRWAFAPQLEPGGASAALRGSF